MKANKEEGKETRLGALAVRHGLVSEEELEAIVAREDERVAIRKGAKTRRIGELLIAEGYLTADVLNDLLNVQRGLRNLPRIRDEIEREYEVKSVALTDYLTFVVRERAQELLVMAGRPPAVRICDELLALSEPPVSDEDLAAIVTAVFSGDEITQARDGRALQRRFERAGASFWASLSNADSGLVFKCRPVDLKVDDTDLRLPRPLADLAEAERGLIVISGSTRSTRAFALARLVELMNEAPRSRYIVTLEQRATYRYQPKNAMIAQREVHRDTESFPKALRAALREDPDVLVVSEVDDPEAIAATILAAESGFLVLCSVNAGDPALAIRHLTDVHAPARRALVRAALANTLRAVVSLDVVPGLGASERYLVADVVPASTAIARLLREDLVHQLPSVTRGESGVVSRDDLILKLNRAGRISKGAALEHLVDPLRLEDAEPAPAGGR